MAAPLQKKSSPPVKYYTAVCLIIISGFLTACQSREQGVIEVTSGYVGVVSASEPYAALVARDTLGRNGTAFDAAIAASFAMMVTLPSRAGIGGGGACLLYQSETDSVKAYIFSPQASSTGAVVPASVKALAVLHRDYGVLPWQSLLSPARKLAQGGFVVSEALARDLENSAYWLSSDPQLVQLYFASAYETLAQGERLVQPNLASTLSLISRKGGGVLYTGTFPRSFAEAASEHGIIYDLGDIYTTTPFIADGTVLGDTPGGTAYGLPIEAYTTQLSERLSEIPSEFDTFAANLVVGDEFGNAVVCQYSMNGLFGLARMVANTGIVPAAPPPPGEKIATPFAVALSVSEGYDDAISGIAIAGDQQARQRLQQILQSWQNTQSIEEVNNHSQHVNGFYCKEGVADSGGDSCQTLHIPNDTGLSLIVR